MRHALLLLASLPAFALSNKVTIYDDATITHTNNPFTISRWFAQGEILQYPQPYIAGVAATVWQADVKNRWPDGSAKHALVSFTATILSGGNIVVDFRNNASTSSGGAALTKAEMLAWDGGAWGAKIQGTASGVVKSASARTILGAASECPTDGWAAAGCYRYWLSGPMVTQVILFGGTANSFGWECDSSGGTCPAVSPYTGTAWKDPTDAKYNSIHPVFVLTFYNGWAGTKVEYILENTWFGKLQDQKFDMELFKDATEATSVYTKAGTVFYAFRRARKVFWNNNAPAGWTSEYEPGIRVDYNKQYLLYSKVVPFLAPEVNTIGTAATYDYDSSAVNLDVVHNLGSGITEAQWCESTGNTCGPQAYSWPSGGTKPELGVLSRSYSRYLTSYSHAMYQAFMQIALMAGSFPIHIRETASLTYTVGRTDSAFGRPISLDSRPLFRYAKYQAGTPVGSRLSFSAGEGVVGTVGCRELERAYVLGCTQDDDVQAYNRWTVDDAHAPRAAYIPYIITGEWYFLEEQEFAASQMLGVEAGGSDITPGCNPNFNRHGELGAGNDWGVPNSSHNVRVEVWGTLHVGQTVLSLPDSSPEKDYYNSKFQKIINARRGMFGITPTASDYESGGSAGDPCPAAGHTAAGATPWCWGFVDRMERKANPTALTSIQGTYTGWGMNLVAACASNMWFENYFRTVYGFLNQAGLTELEPMVALLSKALIRQAIQSNARGGAIGDYSVMMRKASDMEPTQTVAELVSAIKEDTTLRLALDASSLTISVNNQFASVNCSAADAVWMGGINKFVIDPGTADEEFVETLSQPSCTAPGTYTISVSKRGVMGSIGKAHAIGAVMRRMYTEYGSSAATVMDAGYGNIANGAFAYAFPYSTTDEVTGALLTGRRAWETHRGILNYQDYVTSTTCSGVSAKDCQNLMWAFRPVHTIDNVRIKLTSTTAQFWYTAPTQDACRIGVSATAFSATDDSGDTTSSGDSVSRTLTVSGLSSGTYFYRITCGPFNGTARATGSFTL